MRVRVATYNVHSFRAGAEAAAAALGEPAPEVVLLQECGSRRAVSRFAELVGKDYAASLRMFNRARNAIVAGAPWRIHGPPFVLDFSRTGERSGAASSLSGYVPPASGW